MVEYSAGLKMNPFRFFFHCLCFVELLIASENKIEMFSFHADEFDDEHGIHEKIQDDAKGSVLYHLHQKVFKFFLDVQFLYSGQ